MDLAYIVFLHITYLSLLGSVTARMEVVRGDRQKWKFLLSRVRRDLQTPVQSPDATSTFSFIKPEDAKDSRLPQSSNGAHIRVKRYRHSFGNYPPASRASCKFGTCIVHNLANQIYQYTDKDKDSTAPARKISSQGYGRRRRSLPERRLLMPFVDGTFRPQWVSNGKANAGPSARQLLQRTSTQGGLAKTKGKMWQTLLRT